MPQGGTDNADDENITITDENFTRDDLDDSANSTFIKYDQSFSRLQQLKEEIRLHKTHPRIDLKSRDIASGT